MSATFVILKDKYNTQVAHQVYGEANKPAIQKAAREAASHMCIEDDSELVLVGIVWAQDAGAARLKPDEADGNGGISWLAWMQADGNGWNALT